MTTDVQEWEYLELKKDMLRLAEQLEGFAKPQQSESEEARRYDAGCNSAFALAAKWIREILARSEGGAK